MNTFTVFVYLIF